jgi:DinB superfamily
MKKTISTEQTSANITQVMALLAETPQKLAGLSAGLLDEALHKPLGAGERSFIESLAHLLNTEARTSESIYLALLEDEPLFINVHAERQWGKLLHYEAYPFADLLAYFKFRRTVLLGVLSGLSTAQWSRTIREAGKQRRESVYWRARGQALHELEHIGDLEKKLAGSER